MHKTSAQHKPVQTQTSTYTATETRSVAGTEGNHSAPCQPEGLHLSQLLTGHTHLGMTQPLPPLLVISKTSTSLALLALPAGPLYLTGMHLCTAGKGFSSQHEYGGDLPLHHSRAVLMGHGTVGHTQHAHAVRRCRKRPGRSIPALTRQPDAPRPPCIAACPCLAASW